MGNYLSCTLAKAPGSSTKCARLILPDGSVKPVPLPATAAELMLDLPGHFLAAARGSTLRLGSRIAALPADEELELGAVYATFPMKRLGTPLGAADAARLAAAAAREQVQARRPSASAKVASAAAAGEVVVAEDDAAPCCRLRLEEMVDDAAAAEIGELKHRASNARSRRPTLETIEEESYMSARFVVA